MTDEPNASSRAGAGQTAPASSRKFGPAMLLLLFGIVAVMGWNLRQMRQLEAMKRQAHREHLFWVLCHASYPPDERAAAFLKLVADGNTEWHAAQLHGLNFTGASLAGVDLHEIDLTSARLEQAVLTGATLTKANLEQADFTEADLSRATLASADLFRAKLGGAKLVEANLRGANLQEADAREATLQNADLSDAYLLMANLTDANLTGANLTGVNLEAAILRNTNLQLARLNGALLKDTDFTGANWWRARGFTTEHIAMLKRRFAPTDQSPDGLRADYQAWLAGAAAPEN